MGGDEFVMRHHDKLNDIPCLFQLYQYVQWHITAYEIHGGSAHVVRFEDYSNENAKNAGEAMLDYLQVDIVEHNAPSFRGANFYFDHYTDEQRKLAWELIVSIAPQQIFDDLWSYYYHN